MTGAAQLLKGTRWQKNALADNHAHPARRRRLARADLKGDRANASSRKSERGAQELKL